MGAIKRGCLEFLLVWGAAGFALYQFFHGRFEPEGDLIGAAVGGFLLSSSWGLTRNIFSTRSRIALLKRAKSGLMPEDGKPYAAAGKIRPLREALRTPFQQKECVCFGYTVYSVRSVTSGSGSGQSTRNEKSIYMGGFALCPSAIRTSIADVKILGFPTPDTFPEEKLPAAEYRDRVLAYAEENQIPIQKGIPFREMLSQVKAMLTEDDGSHRHEWRTENLEMGLADENAWVEEQCIPVGAEVCIVGTYSAQKAGLLSDLSQGGLEIFQGSLDDAIRSLRRRIYFYIFFGILMAALGSAGVFGLLTARELRDDDLLRKKRDRLSAAFDSSDIASAEELLSRGISPNDPQIQDKVRQLSSTEMLSVLIRNGLELNQPGSNGETPLLSAVVAGDLKRVTFLLDAGADPNVKQAGWGNSPLERAFDDGNRELVRLLLDRGAKGIFVTAKTGQPVAKDGGEFLPLVSRYVEALRAGNVDILRELTDNWPESFFESAGNGFYSGAGVHEPRFERGFANDEAATLLLSGTGGAGREVWVYTLVKRNGSWKIRRESWDDENRWQIVSR